MKRALAFGVLCLSMVTAASAQRTHTEWDHSADFAAIHTYGWQKSPEPAKGDWNQAIMNAVDKQLQAKGLAKVGSDPDVWVVYTQNTRKDTSALGGGYIFAANAVPGSPGIPATPTSWEQGTLVVELGNPKTKQVVWRGAVSNTISDNNNKNLKNLDKDVAKLFKEYPPKGAK